jgi:diguanylate cyclase (GGDEF)-like protein
MCTEQEIALTQPTRSQIVVHECSPGTAHWISADGEKPDQDRLTGLASQYLLVQRLEQAVMTADTEVAILFADIDRFKAIADAHGQVIAERLLVAVAGRLTRLMRPGDTLARLQHDTFVIVVANPGGTVAVEARVAQIDNALNGVFAVGAEVPVRATVGRAFTGRSWDIPAQILHEIESAINQAKIKKHSSETIDLMAMTSPDQSAQLPRLQLRTLFSSDPPDASSVWTP